MELTAKLRSFVIQSIRVWHLLKKPSPEEFKTVSKVSALGILVIGAVGLFISDIIGYIERLFA